MGTAYRLHRSPEAVSGVVLETERLRLRLPREEDLEAYARFCRDAETMHFLGGVKTREEAWRHLAMILGHWQIRGYGMFAVERQEDGAFLGRIGPHRPEGWPGLEVGWLLGPEHQGRGYASEAARASVAFAFEHLSAVEVIHLIDPGNRPSVALARRLGAVHTRDFRFPDSGLEAQVYTLSRGGLAAQP